MDSLLGLEGLYRLLIIGAPFLSMYLVYLMIVVDNRQRTVAFLSGVLSAVFLYFSFSWLSPKYGWIVFVFYPLSIGMISSLVFNWKQERDIGKSLQVSILSIFVVLISCILTKLEGAICIVMAFPLFFILGVLGGLIGYVVSCLGINKNKKSLVVLSIIILNPLLMGFESQYPKNPPVETIKTAVIIQAPIESVWKIITSLVEYNQNPNMLFQAGINHPISSELIFQDNQYFLKCQTKEGVLISPVTVFKPNHQLTFAPKDTPAPMRELSFYSDIHPPHLEGYFKIKEGSFYLTALSDGSTHLEGITTYEHDIYPTAYWRLWSNGIINMMHRSVLSVIKQRAEKKHKS